MYYSQRLFCSQKLVFNVGINYLQEFELIRGDCQRTFLYSLRLLYLHKKGINLDICRHDDKEICIMR